MTRSLYIALEDVFNRDSQGNIWSAAGFEPNFWERYAAVFETIVVVARMRDVSELAPPHLIISRRQLSFAGLRFYRGPIDFLRSLFWLLPQIRKISSRPGYFILRLPGAIGTLLGIMCAVRRRPFAVELVGDPHDVLSGEGFSPIVRMMRAPITLATKLLCRISVGNTYVTERTLQLRYPTGKGRYNDGISSINLASMQISDSAKTYEAHTPFRLFFCGSLAQLYKGPDVLIEAVALLTEKGKDVIVEIAGDGNFRARLENLARDRGVADRFSFRGHIPRGAVLAACDAADVFVMPSRTEGLPRAMVEAMARGMCCIGARVGGIPELLTEDALVPAGDAKALADAIEHAMDNLQWTNAQARRNLDFARKFSADVLGPRRTSFYREVKRLTEEAAT